MYGGIESIIFVEPTEVEGDYRIQIASVRPSVRPWRLQKLE